MEIDFEIHSMVRVDVSSRPIGKLLLIMDIECEVTIGIAICEMSAIFGCGLGTGSWRGAEPMFVAFKKCELRAKFSPADASSIASEVRVTLIV